MTGDFEEVFVVFLRGAWNESDSPEVVERPLIACRSYGEARRIQRMLHHPPNECVIRYLGQAGGGD